MARTLHLVANWKMALGIAESVSLAAGVAEHRRPASVQLTVAPSFPAIPAVAEALKKSTVHLAAQDASAEAPGAHTGDVSLDQLRELGCRWVILGHSERRRDHGETDAIVAAKLSAALRTGVAPILCVGETLEERKANQHVARVSEQINTALARLRPPFGGMPIAIAYEPVWAIGTGEAISAPQAVEMLGVVRSRIDALVAPPFRNTFTVLYGGSVDPSNVASVISAGYHGVLVGTASWSQATLLPLIDTLGTL